MTGSRTSRGITASPVAVTLAAIAAFLLAIGAYTGLFFFSIGPYFSAEYWIHDSLIIKEQALLRNRVPGRTALILSGSNAMYGMDSELLSQRLDRSAVNFGTHIGLGLEYYRYLLEGLIAKGLMGPGDMVIMPLELEFYTQAAWPTDWFVNNMTAWDRRYVEHLGPQDLLRLMVSSSPSRVLASAAMRLGAVPVVPGRANRPEDIVTRIERAWAAGEPGYDHLTFTPRGDYLAGHAPLPSFPPNSYGLELPLQDSFIARIRPLLDLAARHDIEVVLTWPVTMRNASLDFSRPEGRAVAERLTAWLAGHGLTLRCDPAAFQYPMEAFLDTPYHLSSTLRQDRTARLADCLAGPAGVTARAVSAARPKG